MSTIVTRAGKGSALTHNEVDANFTNLNTDKIQSGNTVASLTVTSISGTTATYTNATISSADINGGTIDGAAIGGSSAAAGAFTTLSSTGNTTLGNASGDTVTIIGTVQPGMVISGSSSSDALRITQVGSGNALLVEDSANPDSTPFVIDANGNVTIANATSVGSYKLEVHGADALAGYRWNSATTPGVSLRLNRSRSGTVGSYAVVQSGDTVGNLIFSGDDGSAFVPAAQITTAVDGTPGTNNMPGRLVFSTTADGASTPTERMRIDSAGNVGIGTSSPAYKLDVAGAISTNNNLTFTGTGNRITGDFSNATIANRVAFQTSVANGVTRLGAIPNGTATQVNLTAYNSSDPNNASLAEVICLASEMRIQNNVAGTGSFLPMTFHTGGSERMRVDTSGNVGIGTSSPGAKLDVQGNGRFVASNAYIQLEISSGTVTLNNSVDHSNLLAQAGTTSNHPYRFLTNGIERARIDSSGNLLVGRTDTSFTTGGGITVLPTQGIGIGKTSSANLGSCLYMNRATVGDGTLVEFAESGTVEGNISVSGTTVSYNGGHLSRWAQTATPKNNTLVKGTVLSNLDEMNVYVDTDGNPVANEQLNKVKVSDVEGDANVAGVFVNWSHDDQHNVDEINMAMTGDMIIRIAQGVTVQRGNLLMSAGDGTAKPQGDDIIRSKTIAKVTSIHVTCTYEDGSYCVPCVLMAC